MSCFIIKKMRFDAVSLVWTLIFQFNPAPSVHSLRLKPWNSLEVIWTFLSSYRQVDFLFGPCAIFLSGNWENLLLREHLGVLLALNYLDLDKLLCDEVWKSIKSCSSINLGIFSNCLHYWNQYIFSETLHILRERS